MTFGPNIKRVAAWAGAFVVAQGMVYHWGYEVGYLSGHRQGYGDVFQEMHNQDRSEAMQREALAQSDAGAPGQPADIDGR